VDSDNSHDAKNLLEIQADHAFRRGEDLDSLISELDDTALARCSNLNTGQYRNHPLARAFLVKQIRDLNWSELHSWISQENRATELGFDPDKFADGASSPARTTLTRAWNNRCNDVQDYIITQAERVVDIAAEHGHPVGSPLQPGAADSNGASERTKQRLLRGKAQDVLNEIETLVFPLLSLDRPENPVYDENELLTLEAFSGINCLAANGGGTQLGDELNPNPSLEEPYTADGPTGETLLESIKPLEIEDVTSMFNDAVGKLFTRAKMKDAISTPVTLAIDMAYVGYCADGDELRWALGAPDTKEYDWYFKFATAAVVGDNTHFTVAMLPVGHSEYRDAAAYPGDDQYYRVGEVARELLDTARKYVDVSSVVADREFYAADVIEACEERDLFYLTPAVRNDRIRRTLRRFGSEVYVRKEYGIYGPIKGGSDNDRVETTLVVLPEDDSRDGPSPFVTNLESMMREGGTGGERRRRSSGIRFGVRSRRVTRRSRSSLHGRRPRRSRFGCIISGWRSCCTTRGCSWIS
jgi:hypothetical protein